MAQIQHQTLPDTLPAPHGGRRLRLLPSEEPQQLSLRGTVRRDWRFLVAALVAALAARLPWLLMIHAQASSDSYFYVTSAAHIAAGHGYSILGHPTAFFPVGWPAFLAGLFTITGPSFAAVEVVNTLLWLFTVTLVYLLGERLGGRRAGLVAALIVALEPNMSVYVLRAASENLFIPLLLATCLLLIWRPGPVPLRRALPAALLLGFAILVRSTALLTPLVIAGWLLAHNRGAVKRSLVPAAAVVAVAYVALVPWIVRNYTVMHTVAISTNGGYTLWLGDNQHATGGNGVIGLHPAWPIATAAQEVRANDRYQRETLNFILHDTTHWLGLIPAKFDYLFGWQLGPFHNIGDRQNGSDPRAAPVPRHLDATESAVLDTVDESTLPLKVSYLAYWTLGGIALVLAAVRRRPGASLALVLVALWVVFHVTLVHGQLRYMLAVMPLVAPALGWMLLAAGDYVSARMRSARSGHSLSSV